MVVRFDKVNGKKVILFGCSNFNKKTFETRTKLNKGDTDHYTAKEIRYGVYEITPKVNCEIFVPIEDYKLADLLIIDYYTGTDTKDIVEPIDAKTFIIDDNVPIREVNDDYSLPTGRVNDILKYKGLEHIDKPKEKRRYEGEKYTKIGLLPDCKYHLYYKDKVMNITK